jgi:hypothetical protein
MNYFDLKKFVALVGIEDEIMQRLLEKAKSVGVSLHLDVPKTLAGDQKHTKEEIEIMKEVFEAHVVATKYEDVYETADVDFERKISERNKGK